MARIVIPKDGHTMAKRIETSAPYSSDYYRKIAEEADKRIREAHIREACSYLRAEKFISL